MLKREWGAESNGKLPHLFIPSKTATQVPEFAMEDLNINKTKGDWDFWISDLAKNPNGSYI